MNIKFQSLFVLKSSYICYYIISITVSLISKRDQLNFALSARRVEEGVGSRKYLHDVKVESHHL